MRSLNRKLFRDLWGIRSQVAAIAMVIGAGVATFVMSLNMLGSLQNSKDAYYERNRFADVFASVKRAPMSVVEQVRAIEGVDQVDPRIVVDVTIEVEGMVEPATGRFVSVPTLRRPLLNDVYVRKGRYPEPRRHGEVLVSEPFADAHQLAPGDELWAILNGRRQKLTIVGIALSPEYVIQILGGSLLPDNRRFGVFWMEQ
jgi:putative ABC transport system permease protein